MTEPMEQNAPSRNGRPIRGLLWGLIFGLGLTLLLVVTNTILLAWVPMLVTMAIGTAIGIAWSLFGPARKPKLST